MSNPASSPAPDSARALPPEPTRALLRAQAEALWRRSRELRMRSAVMLRRGEAALHRLELHRELLRTQFDALRTNHAEHRAREARDEAELGAWMSGEVLEMITAGWTRGELADVGIGPDLLRELRLHDHPALGPG